MSIHSVLDALQNSALATGIRNSLIWFPVLEALHVISFGLVFGTILIVDLRLLGVAGRERAYSRVSNDVLKWTWVAFGLALVTGSLMFTTNARVYVDNTFFRIKFALMALAGLNMLAFQLTTARTQAAWEKDPAAPRLGKIAAVLSLVLWLGVIFMGRAIGFTTTGAAHKEAPPPAANVDFDQFLNAGPASSAPSP
jgi:hypothetical protein